MYPNLGTYNIKNDIIDPKKIKNEKKIIKFIPEIKIKDNQIIIIKNVWPISGCEINKRMIGIKIKELIK